MEDTEPIKLEEILYFIAFILSFKSTPPTHTQKIKIVFKIMYYIL